MNRETIKYLAAAAMTLNHIALIFLKEGTLLYTVFVDIGYFTAITMCYFLTEGYHLTRSKKRYGIRLLVFALLSQAPYSLAFHTRTLNFLFTLCGCFLILRIMERTAAGPAQSALLAAVALATACCDWPVLAAGMTILMERSRGDREKLCRSYGWIIGIFALINMADPAPAGGSLLRSVGGGLLAGAGMALSAAVILFWYNGKTAARGKAFHRWFFYGYYPLHMLVLWGISVSGGF